MPPVKHALLGASSAKQWLNCPPSARLQEHIPNPSSPYAEEGTFAHEVCEYKLRRYLHERVTRPQSEQYYSEELDQATDVYYETVVEIIEALRQSSEPIILIEERVDYSHLVPEGFGTADLVILGRDQEGRGILHVCDYKHGLGVGVSADHNPQLMLYALGALRAYDYIYDIDIVRMTIIQPRRDNIATCEMPVSALREWGEKIRPIAQMAYTGGGGLRAGEWCRFCRAQPTCKAHMAEAMSLCREEFADLDAKPLTFKPPASLSVEELAKALPTLERVAEWIKKVQAYLSDVAIHSGVSVPGYKIVLGRSSRCFSDPAEVEKAALAAGYTDIYTHDLISLTAMEKLMGKKEFQKILGPLVIKPEGSPKLVPESDPRPAVTITGASDEFAPVDE